MMSPKPPNDDGQVYWPGHCVWNAYGYTQLTMLNKVLSG
jgi:hypothetical protein